jgi:hypothetical protein
MSYFDARTTLAPNAVCTAQYGLTWQNQEWKFRNYSLKFNCHVASLAESEWRECSWERLSDNFLDGEEGSFKINVDAIVVITIAAAAVAAFSH